MIPIQIKRKMNTDALRQVETLNVLLFEGEVNAHQFLIEPADGVSFAGAAVTAFFVRADNQRVDLTGAVTGEGEAAVTLGPNCYATPGRYRLTIFVTIGEETAAVYACCGSVQPTRGSEVAGDTEPIVEPGGGSETAQMLEKAIEVIHGFYHGNDGSVTVNGVTITRKGFVYTFNGTATGTIFVRLNGIEVEASAENKVSEWSGQAGAPDNISIPNGNYYLHGYNLTNDRQSIGYLDGNGWSYAEDSVDRTDSHYLGKWYSLALMIESGTSFNNVRWMLAAEPA